MIRKNNWFVYDGEDDNYFIIIQSSSLELADKILFNDFGIKVLNDPFQSSSTLDTIFSEFCIDFDSPMVCWRGRICRFCHNQFRFSLTSHTISYCYECQINYVINK